MILYQRQCLLVQLKYNDTCSVVNFLNRGVDSKQIAACNSADTNTSANESVVGSNDIVPESLPPYDLLQ